MRSPVRATRRPCQVNGGVMPPSQVRLRHSSTSRAFRARSARNDKVAFVRSPGCRSRLAPVHSLPAMNAPLVAAGSARLVVVMIATVVACRNPASSHTARPADPARSSGDGSAIVVHDYKSGLAGVHARNPNVRLSLRRDSTRVGDSVLVVEYPPPTGDPAGRDVQLDAATTDWTAGRALSFRINPDITIRLAVSFLDRNRVAYTSWTDLEGGRCRGSLPVGVGSGGFQHRAHRRDRETRFEISR